MKIDPTCGYFHDEKEDEYSPYPGECEECYRFDICMLDLLKEEKKMADAKKCDVCGALYEDYTLHVPEWLRLRNKDVNIINLSKTKYHCYEETKSIELCPKCMKGILDFLDREHEAGEIFKRV